MPKIQQLSPHVADLIAAGEVVERPASAAKELVENAIDAGAHKVTVELRDGGMTFLRVTDDGCGMAPEDAGIAFLRHATSKLHDEQGLEAIGTMGFRGEALAAISAVSHITLTTRQRGAASGTHMTLDAGDIQDMYETGCPEGTTMIVRDLFFNTPARRKFLKSDRAEGAACAAAALRCALGRPDVSVRCIRDGEEVFVSPGDNKLDSCIYSLLGRHAAAVVRHAQIRRAAAAQLHRHGAGPGVKCVFHQLLDHRGGPLHDLARGDQIRQMRRENLNIGHRLPSFKYSPWGACAPRVYYKGLSLKIPPRNATIFYHTSNFIRPGRTGRSIA